MYATIEQYLDALKMELRDDDPALLQEEVADMRAHLLVALDAAREKTPDMSVSDALKSIVADHGSPQETASAYREAKRRTPQTINQAAIPLSPLGGVFGVYIDPRTWGTLVFMCISFVTGILYFTWAVTGLSLSLSFLILIIGAPFAILFLLSVRGLALLEARLVGVLLGVRMPTWPLVPGAGLNWLQRSKAVVTDKRTWLSLLYLFLQMPLGVIYFTMNVTLIAAAFGLVAAPLAQLLMHFPLISFDGAYIFLPRWALGLMEIGGFLLLTSTLHLIRGIGELHGRYAKALLIG
jgi:hypothetical protein